MGKTPDPVAPLLREALHHHAAGRLDEATALYRRAASVAPERADILHLLGMVAYAREHHRSAVTLLHRACRLQPKVAAYHHGLGLALAANGQASAAVHFLANAARLEPRDAIAHANLGIMRERVGDLVGAEAAFQDALQVQPDRDDALSGLGSLLARRGALEQALAYLQQAVAVAPKSGEAHNNLGNLLRRLDRLPEAEAALRTAIRLQPRASKTASNLGIVLAERGAPAAAEAWYRRAIRLDPANAQARNNLGNLLRSRDRLTEAEVELRAALHSDPGYAEAQANLGHVLSDRGDTAGAEACYRTVLASTPDHAEARYSLGALQLLNGDLPAGWAGYEWRWRRGEALTRPFAQPRWDGTIVPGQRLLVHAEQGLGDTLQFCRFIPRLVATMDVTLEVPASLLRLLRGSGLGARLIASGDPLPAFDVECPLPSLPHLLGIGLADLPGPTPYLTADPHSAAMWRRRLRDVRGLKVGIVWAGNPAFALDNRRSLQVEQTRDLATVHDVSLISLQKGAVAPPWMLDVNDALGDMADTASLIMALDLVIGVDTAVVHLAGALGRPVWLLNRFDTCWRWLRDRDDSPWYPGLRIFRQPAPGAWDAPLGAARAALTRAAHSRRDATAGVLLPA